MEKKDYAQICSEIIRVCGGESNLANVTHCMTRLRIQVYDETMIDKEEAKKIPGIINLIVQNGEYQFVIGQDVAALFSEFEQREKIKKGDEISSADPIKQKGNGAGGNVFANIMGFIGGTFSPVIPVLIAGGLTGAVLTLLTTFFGISAEDGTYTVFYAVNQAAFYSLPVFIGFSAASKLKSNGYLGAFLGAILLYSTINNAEGLDFLGIKVQQIAYNSTVFPVILGVLFLSVLYKYLQKIMPVYLRTIFVPLLTMLITVPVTLIILGPIGNFAGTLLADGVLAVYRVAPAIAVMIIGITTPLMVFFGMNNATYPVVFLLLAEIGSDPLICTGMAPANVAVGGACLAAAVIASNGEGRSVATGAGITALCGITEPGVYGVLFVKKYPLIGAMIGGGIGGFLAGMLGMTQYVISTPGFISIPAYINPDGTGRNLIVSLIVMITAVAVSFVITLFLGTRAEKSR